MHAPFQWKVKWIDILNLTQMSIKVLFRCFFLARKWMGWKIETVCTVSNAFQYLLLSLVCLFVVGFSSSLSLSLFPCVCYCCCCCVFACCCYSKSNLYAVEFNQAHCVTKNEWQDIASLSLSLARAIFYWTNARPIFHEIKVINEA